MSSRDPIAGSPWATEPGATQIARTSTRPAAGRPTPPEPTPPPVTLTTTPGAAMRLSPSAPPEPEAESEAEPPPPIAPPPADPSDPGWQLRETSNNTAVALIDTATELEPPAHVDEPTLDSPREPGVEPWLLAERQDAELATGSTRRPRRGAASRPNLLDAPDHSPLYWKMHAVLLLPAGLCILFAGLRPDGLAFAAVLAAGVVGFGLSRLAQGPAILLHAALVLGVGALWLHSDGNLADRWAFGSYAPAALAVLPCFWLAALEGTVGALAGLLLSVALLPVTPADRILVVVVGLVAAGAGWVTSGRRR